MGVVRVCPAVAFDGTNYMVVWEDARDGSVNIYGARVSTSGDVIDPEGIPISSGPSHKEKPAIAFDGDNYMVVWGDNRNGSWDVYGTRVSTSGSVLDQRGIAVSTAVNTQSYPALSFNGSHYLVVWHDERNDFVDIYGARVSVSGSVLDKNGFVIGSSVAPEKPPGPGGIAGTDGPWGPKVSNDGLGFFVVWQMGWGESWDIYGARVTDGGSVLDPAGIAVSTSEDPDWYPDVAYDGTNYLVVWHAVSGGSFDVFAARVTPSGEVLDPDRIYVSEHGFWQRFPTAASDGTNYIVAWANWTSSSQDVYVARVSDSGVVIDPQGMAVIRAEVDLQWRPAVAFDGANYLMVCQDKRGVSGANVYGVLVNRDGAVVTSKDIAISSEGDSPWGPDVCFDGKNHMVVWGDNEGGSGDVSGAAVSAEGVLLDGEAIPISKAAGEQCSPALAYDGANYMVVWQDGRNGTWDIYGARVRPSGFVYEPDGIRMTLSDGNEQCPAIAFDGTNYLVVWENRRDDVWDIYGMRVTPSGTMLAPGRFGISTAAGMQRHPDLAFDGENFMVVWQDNRNGSWDIYGARVTRDGSVLDPSGIPVSAEEDDEWTPSLSFDGADFMVVWQAWNAGQGDVVGARVAPSGVRLDEGAITISAAAGRQWAPVSVFNGTYHVVAWSDSRSGKRNVDVFAARVSPLGGVLDPLGVPVSADRDDQYLPSVAADDSGRLLIAHSWLIPSSIFGYWRVWGVLWGPPEEPPLQLAIGVHQNPELTADLAIYVLPSGAVQDTSVHVDVNGASFEVSATDEEAGIYRTGYRVSGSGPIAIAARARSLAGYLTETTRELAAGFIEADGGGDVSGPLGEIALHCPPNSIDMDAYFLIIPDGSDRPVSEDDVGTAFLLSPPSTKLKRPGTLTIALRDEGGAVPVSGEGGEQGIRPFLRWEAPSGWEQIESTYDERAGKLTASVGNLGRFEVIWGPSDVRGGDVRVVLRNVPSPFRSIVNVQYLMPEEGPVRVCVYDAEGRLVRTLFEGLRGAGWNSASWDGTDAAGVPLPSGVYFTDLRAGKKHIREKCVLIK